MRWEMQGKSQSLHRLGNLAARGGGACTKQHGEAEVLWAIGIVGEAIRQPLQPGRVVVEVGLEQRLLPEHAVGRVDRLARMRASTDDFDCGREVESER
jgi:hypothetical protein